MDRNYKKEDLERMLIKENLSYKKIGEIYNVSGVYIRKLCIKIGIKIPERAKRKNQINRIYIKNENYCKNCKNIIDRNIGNKPIFCNIKCSSEYIRKKSIEYWLKNQNEFRNKLINLKNWVKPYFLEKQKHKCKICGILDEWNGNSMVFILDHIDGNASNNTEENLRLICHNCDSQLPTYKSKNKNSARIKRYC